MTRPRLMAERQREAEALLLRGVTSDRAEKLLAAKWSVGRRQARVYIAAVRKQWLAEAEAERADPQTAIRRHTEARQRLMDLLVECRAKGDRRTAVQVEKTLIQLDGLAPTVPQRVEVTGKDGAPLVPTDSDVMRALRSLSDADLDTLSAMAARQAEPAADGQ